MHHTRPAQKKSTTSAPCPSPTVLCPLQLAPTSSPFPRSATAEVKRINTIQEKTLRLAPPRPVPHRPLPPELPRMENTLFHSPRPAPAPPLIPPSLLSLHPLLPSPIEPFFFRCPRRSDATATPPPLPAPAFLPLQQTRPPTASLSPCNNPSKSPVLRSQRSFLLIPPLLLPRSQRELFTLSFRSRVPLALAHGSRSHAPFARPRLLWLSLVPPLSQISPALMHSLSIASPPPLSRFASNNPKTIYQYITHQTASPPAATLRTQGRTESTHK